MPFFRKRPVVVEAIRFTGHNDLEVLDFIRAGGGVAEDPEDRRPTVVINTLEGEMTAEVGDWIIRDVKGEFYSCRDDIFRETYEPMGCDQPGVR